MSENVIFEKRDNIGIITLNRENVLNAWNKDMRFKICNIFNLCDFIDTNQARLLFKIWSKTKFMTCFGEKNRAKNKISWRKVILKI